jgi:hypothetical protein
MGLNNKETKNFIREFTRIYAKQELTLNREIPETREKRNKKMRQQPPAHSKG